MMEKGVLQSIQEAGSLFFGPLWSFVVAFLAIVVGIIVSRYAQRLIRAALGWTSMGETTIFTNIVRIVIALLVAIFISDTVFHVKLTVFAQTLGQVDKADVFERAAGEITDGAFEDFDHVRDVASGLHGGLEAAHQDFLLDALENDVAVVLLVELLDRLRIRLDMDFGLDGQDEIRSVLLFTQSHPEEHNTGDDCNDQNDKRCFSEWINVSH